MNSIEILFNLFCILILFVIFIQLFLFKIAYMFRVCLLLLFVVKSQLINAQNLVPNPSFESYSQCPYDFGQINFCDNWKTAGMPFWTTPDYFNTCSTNPNISPPIVSWGDQSPHSLNAYAFVLTFVTFPNPAYGREYIIAALNQSLNVNETYFVSFYINLGGGGGVSIGSNKIGALFTINEFDSINYAHPTNFAHVYSDSIITDTVLWYHFRGAFVADSAYNFITIGNFFDDTNIDTIVLNSGLPNASGYFIDDICVSLDSIYCYNYNNVNELLNSNNFFVYPNPVKNDLLISTFNNIKSIRIYDILGRKIIEFNDIMSEKYVVDCTFLTAGIYLVNVNEAYKTIIVQH